MAARKFLGGIDVASQPIINVQDPTNAQDAATKNSATNASNLSSGTVAAARLPAMVGDSGSGGTQGAVPAPGSGDAAALKFLNAGGTWTAPVDSYGDILLNQIFS